MPRYISFQMTTRQVRKRTKTVTRRKGWKFLKRGEVLNACVKAMGLARGEKIDVICQVRVTSVRQEPLNMMRRLERYGLREVVAEGFPDMTPQEFIDMFCENMKCEPDQEITRIEFEYIE